MRRALLGAAIAAGALGVLPAVASAATVSIAALDDGGQTRYSPADLGAKPGDTAEWSFGQAAQFHNLFVVAPGVDPANAAAHESLGVAPPASPQRFSRALDAPGVYLYYCNLHGALAPGGMNGRIVVAAEGDAGPPPPPLETGPAPQPNVSVFSSPFEEGDVAPPALTKVGALARRRNVRVRYQLGEPASVVVRLARGRKAIKTAVLEARRAGVGTVAVKARLRPGSYTVTVTATDAAQLTTTATRKLAIRR